MSIRFRIAKDKEFTEKLTKENMQAYYEQLGVAWDRSLFEESWPTLDNFVIIAHHEEVGILRLGYDHKACYIRDLQIKPAFQNRGIGTAAVRTAIAVARKNGCHAIRLRVFKANPAKSLYERCGFSVLREDQNFYGMERSTGR